MDTIQERDPEVNIFATGSSPELFGSYWAMIGVSSVVLVMLSPNLATVHITLDPHGHFAFSQALEEGNTILLGRRVKRSLPQIPKPEDLDNSRRDDTGMSFDALVPYLTDVLIKADKAEPLSRTNPMLHRLMLGTPGSLGDINMTLTVLVLARAASAVRELSLETNVRSYNQDPDLFSASLSYSMGMLGLPDASLSHPGFLQNLVGLDIKTPVLFVVGEDLASLFKAIGPHLSSVLISHSDRYWDPVRGRPIPAEFDGSSQLQLAELLVELEPWRDTLTRLRFDVPAPALEQGAIFEEMELLSTFHNIQYLDMVVHNLFDPTDPDHSNLKMFFKSLPPKLFHLGLISDGDMIPLYIVSLAFRIISAKKPKTLKEFTVSEWAQMMSGPVWNLEEGERTQLNAAARLCGEAGVEFSLIDERSHAEIIFPIEAESVISGRRGQESE